jgi:hypothetical protein
MIGWNTYLVAVAAEEDWKVWEGFNMSSGCQKGTGYLVLSVIFGSKQKLRAHTHTVGRLVSNEKVPGCSCRIAVAEPLTTFPLATRENAWAETNRAGFTACLMSIVCTVQTVNTKPNLNLLF